MTGTLHGFSTNGWINQGLFNLWLFLHYTPSIKSLVLLMDGHKSYYCPDTICMAAKENIILFTLTPNTTHLTQPLDKGPFGPLKSHWKYECYKLISENPGKVINN